jgi:hypothetical protein
MNRGQTLQPRWAYLSEIFLPVIFLPIFSRGRLQFASAGRSERVDSFARFSRIVFARFSIHETKAAASRAHSMTRSVRSICRVYIEGVGRTTVL